MADVLVTPKIISIRYPTIYSRFDQSTVDDFINLIILEAYSSLNPAIFGSDYPKAVKLYVAAEMQKEIDRSNTESGTVGLESSRTVVGEYTVSYQNRFINGSTDQLDANKNEYEIELERLFRQYVPTFIVN